MATNRASEDALHDSLPGSPPLSSNVGSPHGSGHDLDLQILTNTSRLSVKPWVWSPPESTVFNKTVNALSAKVAMFAEMAAEFQ